jgi:NAD(P)-dependent dehydrogenase (short-subunit alcohol dehydrogenase family)
VASFIRTIAGRFGEPNEVAKAAFLLASDGALFTRIGAVEAWFSSVLGEGLRSCDGVEGLTE